MERPLGFNSALRAVSGWGSAAATAVAAAWCSAAAAGWWFAAAAAAAWWSVAWWFAQPHPSMRTPPRPARFRSPPPASSQPNPPTPDGLDTQTLRQAVEVAIWTLVARTACSTAYRRKLRCKKSTAQNPKPNGLNKSGHQFFAPQDVQRHIRLVLGGSL